MSDTYLLFDSEQAALDFIAELDAQLGYPDAASGTETCTRPIVSDDGTQWAVNLHDGIYSHTEKRYVPLDELSEPMCQPEDWALPEVESDGTVPLKDITRPGTGGVIGVPVETGTEEPVPANPIRVRKTDIAETFTTALGNTEPPK